MPYGNNWCFLISKKWKSCKRFDGLVKVLRRYIYFLFLSMGQVIGGEWWVWQHLSLNFVNKKEKVFVLHNLIETLIWKKLFKNFNFWERNQALWDRVLGRYSERLRHTSRSGYRHLKLRGARWLWRKAGYRVKNIKKSGFIRQIKKSANHQKSDKAWYIRHYGTLASTLKL